MTNFEFYKDEIFRCLGEENYGVAIINNKPERCEARCRSCIRQNIVGECVDKLLFEWLYAEHIEKPKLTKRERAFCEAVQTGWIARNSSEKLFWYKGEPYKHQYKYWTCVDVGFRMGMDMFDLPFDFIKWEDEKPWAVEDLLKLEVQEE